jgi:chromosome segregation ATPase
MMDEYDVFLDESTRKTTLETIRDYSLMPANRGRQFFIITPHKLSNIKTSNLVRIKEMVKPKSSSDGSEQMVI